MVIVIAIMWLVFCFVVAAGAKNRGRSYIGYLLISFFLSPLVGMLIMFILGPKPVK